MLYIKKLIFALPFILATIAFCYQAEIFLGDILVLFSLDIKLLFQLIFFAALICATAYFFIVFASIAADWKIVLPIALISSLSTLLFGQPPTSYFLAIGLFLCFCISFAFLFNKISKEPTGFSTSIFIIKPSKQLTVLLVLITSAIIYFSISATKEQVSQKLIDSIVNLSTKFVKNQQGPQTSESTLQTQPSLSQDQINLLKQNPQLLKQYGIDLSTLNQLEKTNTVVTPQSLAVEAVKPIITKQITDFITPYIPFVPFLIAFIFYLNFQFFTSIISLVFSPIIYLLFLILEKIGFIRYEITTREIKKLTI